MKTFKKSMAIILSILMLFSVMTVAGISASAADEETATIYFVNSGNWDTVNAYIWLSDGSDLKLKAWPGTAMTATSNKAANNADVYALEYVDAGYDRIIFNNGTDKTGTLVVKQGLYYDYLADSWYTDATLEEEVTDPTVDPSQIKYYVAGDEGLCGASWKPALDNCVMTANGDGTYTKVFKGVAAGKYGFKVTDGTWDHSWGVDGGETDIKITVAEDNTDVTITFDLNTKLTTVTMAAGATPSESSEDTTASETESQETTPSETESQETTPSETESQETTASETESQETTPSETESQETTPSETESQETTASETEATEASSETEPAPVFDYYVVGSPELFGANWAEDPANGMTKGDDGNYYLTIENAPAGSFGFKVKDSNGGWHPEGMGNDGAVTTTGGEKVIFCYNPDAGVAIVSTDGQVPTYPVPTKPTETEPKPTETEPTQPTEPACDHATTKTVGAKAATYFAKGNTGDKVCAVCGEVIEKGRTIAVKKLKTPKVTVKPAKKAIKVTYNKVKDAKGFKVTYKLGKKTYNEKFTLSKKELKKAKVTKTIKVKKSGKYKVTVKAFVTSAKKTAYSDSTKAATAKVK